jgi:hypothetical protein
MERSMALFLLCCHQDEQALVSKALLGFFVLFFRQAFLDAADASAI